MTVCIAAICADGRAIVVAADRMLTMGPPLSMELEQDRPKIQPVGGRHLTLVSGDAVLGSEIVRAATGALRERRDIGITVVGRALVDAYVAVRSRLIEDHVLRPIGYSLQQFLASGAAQLGQQIFNGLVQQMAAFVAGVELLAVGFDDSGPRIAFIYHPGSIRWQEPLGFHAMGTGGIHAGVAFLLRGCSTKCSVEQAMFDVFAAKKAAEIAPGVGSATDMVVMTRTEHRPVPEGILRELERLHTVAIKPYADSDLKEIQRWYSSP
ncbi:MAG: hypothetical protein HYY06_09855 [Deltaproteobacteria bacterium]|nr:hypothetical protein [Deltaproteobacteria bacterium]